MDMLDAANLGLLPAFATSLAIGLLIGLERERAPSAKAGLRTIALTALFGTLCALLGDFTSSAWIPAAGLLVVGLMIVAAYHHDGQTAENADDPGTTTVIAVLLAFGLGVLVYFDHGNLAVIVAIAATALLYFKPELRGALQRFSRRDLLSVLQFCALTFVILPMLPDQGYGPYGALNPRRIWLMVVLISGLSLVGYIALRLLGQRRSTVLLGIFGGMVSTTATTLLFSRQGRDGRMVPLASRVILIANLVLLVRLGVLAAVVAWRFLPTLLPVLGCALAAGAVATFLTRQTGPDDDLPQPETANPTELRAALGFGAAFAVVLFLAAWLTDVAGTHGLYAIAVISGLTDTDAITLSTLQLFDLGNISADTALTAIVLALLANQTVKLALVRSLGGTALFRHCAGPMLLTGAVAAVAAAVLR
ncbi:MAG: MgtC/SapB family protein [Burkholderiales bacterium]|nr:MgtC/SapB family protein [Burkholderiales bacterium]